jgi:hypothetical protein
MQGIHGIAHDQGQAHPEEVHYQQGHRPEQHRGAVGPQVMEDPSKPRSIHAIQYPIGGA